MRLHTITGALAALALFASPAAAQVDISTTDINGWRVACTPIAPGAQLSTPCDGSEFNPVELPRAGGWPVGPWIGTVAPVGSLGDNTGESPRWLMTFRKYFTLAGVNTVEDRVQVNATRFMLDNYLEGININGTGLFPAWGATGAPLAPTGTNWNKVFSFTAGDEGILREGENYLEFRITGNGVTDGFALEGSLGIVGDGRVVPEPASLALLGFGVIGLGTVVRRRRGQMA